MTKYSFLAFALTFALAVSICLNLWLAFSMMRLNSEIAELEYLKGPMVHLIRYKWQIIPISWEFEYVQVNFTLFNSGYTDTEFVLSIDLLDNEGRSFSSEEFEVSINATSKKVFDDVRLYRNLMFDQQEVAGIEFYCIYFFENSLGYEPPIH